MNKRVVCEANEWHGATLATHCPECGAGALLVDTVFQRFFCAACGWLKSWAEDAA